MVVGDENGVNEEDVCFQIRVFALSEIKSNRKRAPMYKR